MNTHENPRSSSPRPVMFLDRDGTVIANKHYLCDPDGVELLPGAAEGLRRLGASAHLVLVSNQSGIGRGYFGEAELAAVNAHLEEVLADEGVHLFGLYHCPHAPDAGCACRKPGTLMATRALDDLRAAGHEPGALYVLGDNLCDVDLALAVNGQGVLVRTGHGRKTEAQLGHRAPQVLVVNDLREAADVLLAGSLGLTEP